MPDDHAQEPEETGGVLTKAAKVGCLHGGVVQVTAQSKLTVAKQGVLVATDVKGRKINNANPVEQCKNVTDKSKQMQQCSECTGIDKGVAEKLTVNKSGVLLSSLSGSTDGSVGGVPGTIVVAGGQTKLTVTRTLP